MMKLFKPAAVALLAAILLLPGAGRAGAAEGAVIYSVEAAFEDVAFDVSDAIINRGYVIDYTARISEMLDRTAADVGATAQVFSAARISQFCSAVISRNVMEIDPENIAFCPYGIFIYELADQPGIIYVGYRRLEGGLTQESTDALDEVNALLDDIAREATGME